MINPLFSAVKLNEEGLMKVNNIRVAFTQLLDELESILPGNSREMSIIKTKLEESSFYAVKAVRNYEGNRALAVEKKATEKETARLAMYTVMNKQGCEERAARYIVVDTTPGCWERTLHLEEKGWLGTANEEFPTTIFDTTEKAEQAIKRTRELQPASVFGSNNKFAVLRLF